jgi:hypothetical protein
MKEQIENAVNMLKQQDVDGCITGSCLLDYFEGQDVDLFCYNESSFNKLLFFCYYNPSFLILNKLEEHKFNDYIDNGRSSLKKLGLITIKFKYNMFVDVNIIYKPAHKTCFDVIANFDLDIVATAYDIKTKQTISLRKSTGMEGTWNIWNENFYKKDDFWSIKRILRQFERVVKYTKRGYNLDEVTDKYIQIVEEIVNLENFYETQKGRDYFNDTIEQFQIVLKILKEYKKTKEIDTEDLTCLKTLI